MYRSSESERRVHLGGRERLRLLNQSRHLIDEFTTRGTDRLSDGPERKSGPRQSDAAAAPPLWA